MRRFYNGKKVLIIGAAGTVGGEIARQLSGLGLSELKLVDNNESEMFFLMEKYKARRNVFCFMGDVRDSERICDMAGGMDIIIHAAAYKHVILSEYNPFDAVQTNIIGVENVIRAAKKTGVKCVLFTSSDKAVNPTNVMGTSKLMGERLMTAANAVKSGYKTIFSSTRFGNVVGSRGSVVPLFYKQVKNKCPVTITDRRMTRFIMTIEESARLVLRSVTIARGGEVFVTKMPVVRIPDLAEAMIKIAAPRFGLKPSDIKTEMIGAKPGEKLFEELMSDEERHRSLELNDMFVVTPAFKSIYKSINYKYPKIVSNRVEKSYVSSNEKPMSVEWIVRYLKANNVIETLEGSA